MPYGLKQTVAPIDQPVSVPELKAHCRVTISDDDKLIESYAKAMIELIEAQYDRQLCTATWRLTLDSFPLSDRSRPNSVYQTQTAFGVIRLPRSPLGALSSIVYVDTTGATQTLATDQYKVSADTEPGRITPAYGKIWPVTRWENEAVKVTYTAGYGLPPAVPEMAKLAIKILTLLCYEERQVLPEIPPGVQAILMNLWPGTV